MKNPIATLAWEFWQRHRIRWIILAATFAGFAVIYPLLCKAAGFDWHAPDAFSEVAALTPPMGPEGLFDYLKIFYLTFLCLGPMVGMALSFLFVAWAATSSELDSRTKDPMTFSARKFILPLSTPFLFWTLWLGGLVAMSAVYVAWTNLAPLPRISKAGFYPGYLAWITFLALSQGISWTLASWPNIRSLILAAILFCFFMAPTQPAISQQPFLLPGLFVLGLLLARVGLQKMRHGQWQGWHFATLGRPLKKSIPSIRFHSSAEALLWFEWKRSAHGLLLMVTALAIPPVLITLVLRCLGKPELFSGDQAPFQAYLVVVPVFVHFCYSISPPKTNIPFQMNLPVKNSDMIAATLKAAAITTVLSWLIIFLALGALALLGGFRPSSISGEWIPVAIGLVFLTWRMIAVNHCFIAAGLRWLSAVLAVIPLAALAIANICSYEWHPHWDDWWLPIDCLLFCLVIFKVILAFWVFDRAVTTGVARASWARYFFVWDGLVVVLIIAAAIFAGGEISLLLPMALVIVLLVPLVRIGFAPLAMKRARHE